MSSGLLAMAASSLNVCTKEGLKKVDELLAGQKFISGAEPSKDDLAVYGALTGAPGSEHANVARWYKEVSEILGARFPGEGVGVSIGSAAVQSRDAPAAAAPVAEDEDDDDLDLFGEETEEEKAASAAREAAKKASGKKAVIGKSSVLLDVKPWDDETDMKKLEECVRAVQMDGLFWGASKLVPVGYGIKKLQIMMTIEDDKVSPDNLIEDYLSVEPASDYIQSCDIVAFNKI